MIHLARMLLTWSVRRILLFVVILAAAVAVAKAKQVYDELPGLRGEIESLRQQERLLAGDLAHQQRAVTTALAEIDRLEAAALRRRLAVVRGQIGAAGSGGTSGMGLALQAAQGDGGALARETVRRFRLQALQAQEVALVARLRALAHGQRLGVVNGEIAALEGRIGQLERRIASIERANPLAAGVAQIPLVRRLQGPWRELRAARQEQVTAKTRRQQLVSARRTIGAALRHAQDARRGAYQAIAGAPLSNPLRRRIEEKEAELKAHWGSQLWAAVSPVLGWALWITLLIIVTPPAVKGFWFYVLAPAASRLPPVRIGVADRGEVSWAQRRRLGAGGAASAVTWQLRLERGEQALLRPEYLQSSVAHARIDSQMLLSWRIPLASLATGLIGVTRIVAERDTSLAVSANRDPLDEIGVFEVSDGSSLVLRPRHLVGIVQPGERAVEIVRLWTADRLASWMTLRLRHIIFRGPCTLLVKGARGLALEPAEGGRRIAGAATVGWSAGLDHSIDRTETFLAYLTGKQSLFNDRFDGDGKVIYEEMPRAPGKSGLFGRGLEGLSDAMLKVVGL